MNYEQSNVGLSMVPHRKGCRCDECEIDRLKARLAEAETERDLARGLLQAWEHQRDAAYERNTHLLARLAEAEEVLDSFSACPHPGNCRTCADKIAVYRATAQRLPRQARGAAMSNHPWEHDAPCGHSRRYGIFGADPRDNGCLACCTERMASELAEVSRRAVEYAGALGTCHRQIGELGGELADARRDAERYRWLRQHPPIWLKHEGDNAPGYADELDAAIDAALAARFEHACANGST